MKTKDGARIELKNRFNKVEIILLKKKDDSDEEIELEIILDSDECSQLIGLIKQELKTIVSQM